MRLTLLSIALCLTAHAWASNTSSPFFPGETSSYEVSYLGIPMAQAQVKVGAVLQQAKQRVWPVIFLGKTRPFQPYPVNDTLVSYWNPETQKSAGIDLFLDENRKRRREKIKFNHQTLKASVVRQKEGEPPKSATYDIGPHTMDVAAAALYLRTQALHIDKTIEIPVFTGKKNFSLKARVAEKQRIKTRLGETDAFLIFVQSEFEGNLASKRDIRIFLSADERRLPLLLEADLILGKLVAELIQYEAGKNAP